MLNNKKFITIFQVFLVLGLVALYPSLGFSAGDPLAMVEKNVKDGITTFQLIALSIAGLSLVITGVAGAFGRLDTNKMLGIFVAIIVIAGAVLFVNWIAGWIK
jgi:hypothetical protein